MSMKEKFIKIGRFFAWAVLHLVVVFAVVYAFWPIATWYLAYRPVWGVDFFLLPNLANLLSENLVRPWASWIYAWFGGYPISYGFLFVYLGSFLDKFLDLVVGTQYFVVASSVLFVLGSYFLFFVICRNFVLAGVLAVATAYSGGVYQTLTWAGSLPSYIAQSSFPWALGFLVLFLKTSNYKFLLTSALISGLSVLGHPLTFVIYIVPATMILIFSRFEHGFKLLEKIKIAGIFILISTIVGLPVFGQLAGFALKYAFKPSYSGAALSTTEASGAVDVGAAAFNKLQPARMFSDNHPAPFILLAIVAGLFLLSVILGRKPKPVLAGIPYILIAAYFAFYVWLFGQGISIYHGGWYRLFWHVPVWIGMLVCAFWFQSFVNFSYAVKTNILRLVLNLGATLAILLIGRSYLYASGYGSAIASIIYRSQVSSSHPDILNLKITDKDRSELKMRLLPGWINGDDTNWRLYSGDQTVNLWWNSMFKMPLARGYLDPPIEPDRRGFLFLLDAGLSEDEGQAQLSFSFKYPQESAISSTLFLVDWNSVKYFEGGHIGSVFKPVPQYLTELLVKREEVLSFDELKYTKRSVTLKFVEFKDEVTSAILTSTNASTLGIFATEIGFENVLRAISLLDNNNSQKLIPVKLGKMIDEYNLKELSNFDALYLYDYDFKNGDKTFKRLAEFVSGGGRVYVDTGVEVKNSSGVLPELFPVKEVERKGMGKEWDLEVPETNFSEGVDFSKFSPLVFDGNEWNVSSASVSDLRDQATVIMKHKGRVVFASQKFGSGEVIWGGFNLPYHVIRDYNSEEAKFFNKILAALVDLGVKKPADSEVRFVNSNTREITTVGARAVLFKEQAYSGWSAKLKENEQGKSGRLKIYKAGPAYPGFMYIPLPNTGKSKVELTFSGSGIYKVQIIVSVVTVLFLVDGVVLGGLFLGRLRRFVWNLSKRKIGKWWEKEEE